MPILIANIGVCKHARCYSVSIDCATATPAIKRATSPPAIYDVSMYFALPEQARYRFLIFAFEGYYLSSEK